MAILRGPRDGVKWSPLWRVGNYIGVCWLKGTLLFFWGGRGGGSKEAGKNMVMLRSSELPYIGVIKFIKWDRIFWGSNLTLKMHRNFVGCP